MVVGSLKAIVYNSSFCKLLTTAFVVAVLWCCFITLVWCRLTEKSGQKAATSLDLYEYNWDQEGEWASLENGNLWWPKLVLSSSTSTL